MKFAEFCSKKTGKDIFSKIFNYILLIMGSSPIVDVEKITLRDNIEISYFIGESNFVNYDDVCFVKKNGKVIEIEFAGKRIKTSNILNCDLFIENLKENILELGLSIKFKEC